MISSHQVCWFLHYDVIRLIVCTTCFYNRVTITLAGIACIIMREVYATIGESIYPNPSFLSRDFPEASGRLLRNLKEFTFQDMVN